jgi:hypothetical protein
MKGTNTLIAAAILGTGSLVNAFAGNAQTSPEPTDADKCVHQQLDALRESLKDIPGLKTFKMEKIDGLNEFCEKQTGTKVTDTQASRNIQFNF